VSPYYGVRRLGPYLGVIQVIDVGDACAYSLLAHQNLSRHTRERLEYAACQRPVGLLVAYPLIPEIFNQDAIDVALVSAKLMNAG